MTKKRGQYRSYQKLISKNEKQLIIKELIKGKRGIIAKTHKKQIFQNVHFVAGK